MIAAILTWQNAVLAACLALCFVLVGGRPSRHALLAPLCFMASIFLFNVWALFPNVDLGTAYKIFNAGVNGALVVYLAALFYFVLDPPHPDDLAAKLLWLVVVVAEIWGLLVNNIGCNLILETATFAEVSAAWGVTEPRYVCERELGIWIEWTPLLLEIGLIAWLVHRFTQTRRKLNEEEFNS